MEIVRKRVGNIRQYQQRQPKWYQIARKLASPCLTYIDWRQRQLYQRWQQRHPVVTAPITERPLISIVVPLYNTPAQYLAEMVAWVQGQSYDNWELILVDDLSTDQRVRDDVRQFVDTDPRIKGHFLPENRHIAGATNAGIAQARGDFVSLLDHDDLLHQHALWKVVEVINQHPGAQFIYTDEAKYDTHGPYQPFFKPDWNPDFLRSVNYITHFSTIKRSLLEAAGGEDGRYNGTQDWELFLRLTRQIAAETIYHIPHILYYWRVHQASTAGELDAKPYVVAAQRQALEDDIAARQVTATVQRDPVYGAQWRIDYTPPERPTVSYLSPSQQTVGEVLPSLSSHFVILSQQRHLPPAYIRALAAEAARSDVGVVSGRLNDSLVRENLRFLLADDTVRLIQKLNRRSFTRHIYLTATYNIPEIDSPLIMIDTAKLRQLDQSTPLTSRALSRALQSAGYRTVYSPHITVNKEEE